MKFNEVGKNKIKLISIKITTIPKGLDTYSFLDIYTFLWLKQNEEKWRYLLTL